ncbi:hypothetical protein RHSIM_Rhsim03G0121800 [Rhododendron simsii]|uniref:CCHC-type domain-containing protein n=1 Tax=Rhododendron simsii TaxID=118357 RepID=A0A834H6C9_RHOSS|nr:hypothetical protein RHSIM_Rhsim03G0121800 [Rhododendron simsii]
MIGLVRQCVGQEVFHHIAQETNAYTLWTKRDSVLVKDVAEQGVANEEAGEFEAQEWEFCCNDWEMLVVSLSSAGWEVDHEHSQGCARSPVYCYRRGHEGHIQRNCPKNDAGDGNDHISEATSISDVDEWAEALLVIAGMKIGRSD